MSQGIYELDFSQSKQLEEKMKLIPEKAEELVNKSLKRKGTKAMIESITGFMPVSRKKKVHAKFSKPLSYSMRNLGFVVRAKGGAANKPDSFGYLVFPDKGIGPHNHIKQDFFERGGEKANELIMNQVIDDLEAAHKMILGGK